MKDLFLALLVSAAMTPGAAFGQAESFVTESAEETFVRLTRQLEARPLADTDKSQRTWLLDWATQSKDVAVVVCDILGPIPSEEHPFGSHLLTQMLFGNAAFQITHPESRADTVAVQIAGIESSLAAYSSILDAHPESRIPYFDDLLEKQKDGLLINAMTSVILERCGE